MNVINELIPQIYTQKFEKKTEFFKMYIDVFCQEYHLLTTMKFEDFE